MHSIFHTSAAKRVPDEEKTGAGTSSRSKTLRNSKRIGRTFDIIRPARESGERVRVNISGTKFETYMNTLTARENSIFKLDQITELFDSRNNEYYFERDPKAFEAILVYMQTGLLEKPEKVPFKVYIEELQFFGFHDVAKKVYTDNCIYFQNETLSFEQMVTWREFVWRIFEYPRFNKVSKSVTLLNSVVILLSAFLVCISTIKSVEKSAYIGRLQKVQMVCVGWFTLESIIRFITCNNKIAFVKNLLNIVDIMSFLLVYILKLVHNADKRIFLPSVLRLLRITRLIQAFGSEKFVRIFDVMILTLLSSVKEFSIFTSLLLFLLMLFSCLLYAVENGHTYYNEDLSSVPKCVWFCLVTITSVGYGDIVPSSAGGRFVTEIMFGATILILSLPVPIIINNFMSTLLKTDDTMADFIFDQEKSTEVEKMLTYILQRDESLSSRLINEGTDG